MIVFAGAGLRLRKAWVRCRFGVTRGQNGMGSPGGAPEGSEARAESPVMFKGGRHREPKLYILCERKQITGTRVQEEWFQFWNKSF